MTRPISVYGYYVYEISDDKFYFGEIKTRQDTVV